MEALLIPVEDTDWPSDVLRQINDGNRLHPRRLLTYHSGSGVDEPAAVEQPPAQLPSQSGLRPGKA